MAPDIECEMSLENVRLQKGKVLMATLSPARMAIPLLDGLTCVHRGKVRDTYELPNGMLLQVVTNGVSAFDFVLNTLVPMKGIILAALTIYWFKQLEALGIKTHMVTYGKGIDAYLPEGLRNNADLQSRALVISKHDMIPFEFVFRTCLTGSFMKPEKRGGNIMPEGMQEGDMFPSTVFNPTTKEEKGNDKPVDFREVLRLHPEACATAQRAYELIGSCMKTRGLLLVDGKLELGMNSNGEIVVCDEPPTPDAARIIDAWAWELSRMVATGRKLPPTFDKQWVRAWCIAVGISDLKPENLEHVARVHGTTVPADVIIRTTEIYRYIFWRITGMQIEAYLTAEMGVKLTSDPVRKRVAIVCGSESDLPVVERALAAAVFDHDYFVHVISCHRNPSALRDFAEAGCECANLVIAVGGKAFALPGVLAALLQESGHSIPVVGVVLGEPTTEALLAAKLSIEQLPDRSVVMDEKARSAYEGEDGLRMVLERVQTGEFPPPRPSADKPARYNVLSNCS